MLWMTYPPDDPAGLVDAVVASGVDGFLTPARGYGRSRGSSRGAASTTSTSCCTTPCCATSRRRSSRTAASSCCRRTRGRPTYKPVVLPDSSDTIVALRRLGLTAPVAMGIGIGNVEQARAAVAMGADGVIVGSLTVEALLAGRDELASLLRSMRGALDGS